MSLDIRIEPNDFKHKIKILYTSPFGDFTGGGQRSLFYLIKYLDKNRFITSVILPHKGSFYDKLISSNIQVDIISYSKISHLNIFKIIRIILYIKKNKIQIIHTDDTTDTFYYGIAGKLLHIPVIWHIRVSNRKRFLDKILTKLCKVIIPVSKELKKYFPWLSDKKIFPVYNGFDFSIISSINKSSIRKDFNIKSSVIVANIGRIEERKEQFEIIMRANNINNNATILFIGSNNTDYYSKIQDFIKNTRIGTNILFTGYRNDIYSILREIDILLFSARFGEGLPRTIIEAMAFGKPVVSMNCTGAEEAIRNGETGFLITSDNYDDLIVKLNLLIKNKKLRTRMGEKSFKKSQLMFDIEKNVKKIQQIYNRILVYSL